MRLIRRFVFWFAEYFPFLFPLLLAAFFLVHINSAMAADIVPADAKPAKLCDVWRAAASGIPNAGTYEGCSAQEAANAAYVAMMPVNACQLYPRNYKGCEPRVMNSSYWGTWGQRCDVQGSTSCQIWEPAKYLDSNSLQNWADTHLCPPDAYPDYTIGPLEKEDGTKWCAKPDSAPNPCEDKANTEYTTPVHFYSLDLSEGLLPTCKEGCEVVSGGKVGVCFPITLPSGTEANKCTYLSATFTGNVCPFDIGEAPATSTGDEVGTPKEPSNTEQDCVPSYNAATGITSCTGVKNTENPGTSSCGTVNGTWTCVPNNDGGSSTTTDQREIINSTDPVTGNTTTTDRTTSTTVTCKGTDCTSTAKTTTTTTVKGPDGSVISSSTGCVGSGCGAGAPGDPDAEGDELTPPEYPSMPNPDEFTDSVNDGLQGYEDGVMGHFERDDYDHMTTIDDGTADSVAGAITASMGSGCTNPVIPVGPWSFTVDMCYYAEKIRPYLDFLCVMLTLIYLWHLLRDAIYNTGA